MPVQRPRPAAAIKSLADDLSDVEEAFARLDDGGDVGHRLAVDELITALARHSR